MNLKTQAILTKEWIKLRKTVWLLLLIVLYAAGDTYLYLHGQNQLGGALGLWGNILSRHPDFYSSFNLLALCGVLLGFFQFWPECQGKRLRLFFHMPMEPWRLLSVQLLTGITVLIFINLLSFGLLLAAMALFNLPYNIIEPIMYCIVPWALLSFIAYFVTGAFLAANKLALRLLVLMGGYCAFALLFGGTGYGEFSQAALRYAAFTIAFIPLVFFTHLRFLSNPTYKAEFNFVRAAALLVVLIGMNTVVPDLYWRMVVPQRTSKSMLFSPVENEFVQIISSTQRKIGVKQQPGTIYVREDGTEIEYRDYCGLLPVYYARNLQKWGMFPETINGKKISFMKAAKGWSSDRFGSASWNSPEKMLHVMMESKPEGASFVMPDDFFRVSRDGMKLEFLRPETGGIDIKKSDAFNKALKDQGFVFPVLALGGNPTKMKSYNVGYFLVDAENTLFQLKMTKGNPVCVNSHERVPGKVLLVRIREKEMKKFYGFIVSTEGIYGINMNDLASRDDLSAIEALAMAFSSKKDKSLQKLPIENFDPQNIKANLHTTIVGNSLKVSSYSNFMDPVQGLGLDGDFKITHVFAQPKDSKDISGMKIRNQIESFLFPLRIEETQSFSNFIRFVPMVPVYPWIAFLSGIFSACLVIAYYRSNKIAVRKVDLILALLFGPGSLIVISLANRDASFNLVKTS